MKNFVQKGAVLTVTASRALASGDAILVGSVFGVATNAAANGDAVEIDRIGVFDLPCLTADTGSFGTKMYWDNTNFRLTTTATSNTLVGALVKTKAGTESTARVLLDGVIR